MRRLTKRQGLLAGGLALALVVLAADALTGRGAPAPAQAADTSAAPANAPTWQDVSPLVQRLTSVEYASVAPQLGQLSRDLFRATPLMEAAFTPPEPPPDLLASAAAAEASERQGFDALHRLVAVMLGRKPLAVVNDRVVPVGGTIDGYVLIELGRDRAVFEESATGERVTLELPQRPETR